MYEVSCRDLGVADCEFDVMAYSLERLERAVLTHARYSHPHACAALDVDPGSPERRAFRARILAAAREVAVA